MFFGTLIDFIVTKEIQMKQTLVLFGASVLLYSCSPKVSRSVADSSTGSTNTTTKTEANVAPAVKATNTPATEDAKAINPSR